MYTLFLGKSSLETTRFQQVNHKLKIKQLPHPYPLNYRQPLQETFHLERERLLVSLYLFGFKNQMNIH